MKDIGIRDLKARASEIVHAVREGHERYVITHRGRPVGLLCPLDDAPPAAPAHTEAWDELLGLAERLADGWPRRHSAVAELSRMRR